MKLSIVLPIFHEKNNVLFPQILAELKKSVEVSNEIEIIVVDSYSKDNTLELVKEGLGITVHQIEATSRAERLNKGVELAQGEWVFLHHPRSLVDAQSFIDIIAQSQQWDDNTWAGLRHEFDVDHYFLRYISWYSNNVRLAKKSIVYLDHCFVMSRHLAKAIFPIPDMDIFEDTEISVRLKEHSKPLLLDQYRSLTSAIRFVNNGIYTQYITNQLMKLGYSLNISPTKLNKWYERRTALNTYYDDSKQNKSS